MQNQLSALVRKAHTLTVFGRPYHPYFLASDMATCAMIIFIAVQDRIAITFPTTLAAILVAIASHRIYLRFKARITGSASRSLLQDTVLVVLPSYVMAHLLLGNSVSDALDVAAFFFPLYFGIVRIGCFLGGCCYGVPNARFGFIYPPVVFDRKECGCRKFSSGERTDAPVIPIQLIESAFHLSVFAYLYFVATPERGKFLPLYFILYGSFRFIIDFWRRSSARPRRGPFSEAQLVALVIGILSAFSMAV
ncbi:prolipoprotein diacylglyceryl transferase family protein [Oligoflexus tunisiensis]|uniref:prolipoprotein diacylglyceryl transferase family protein n=1 Tax=Oligoflexus tunisiensis TaxID=708132 RepID=UPI000AC1DDCE|nr:prolipoprotein diacylglyceryl transferase family protein [Oligoflexus tunisiensis]